MYNARTAKGAARSSDANVKRMYLRVICCSSMSGESIVNAGEFNPLASLLRGTLDVYEHKMSLTRVTTSV